MNIGISNIAFKKYSFSEMLRHLELLSLRGIEIAPTLLWDNPVVSSKTDRKSIKELCVGHGITIIGLQSLLFNRPDLQLFDSSRTRAYCREYIERMIQLCADLGGALVVFGAAKNRKRGILTLDKALSIATSFFYTIANAAKNAGVFLCIEPLSSKYSCDFITSAEEGAELVQLVNHPNFRLLLDTGSMSLNGESCQDMIIKYADVIAHMHINDPHLSPPGAKSVDHSVIADALRKINYRGWLTLEFLSVDSSLGEDIAYALKYYGNGNK